VDLAVPIENNPEENAILLVWFNHYAGVLIKTPSKTLIIDPVDIRSRSFPNADAVLITHEHYDHLDQRLVKEIQKNTDCQIIADPASTKRLQHLIPPDKLTEINSGSEILLGKVLIKAQKCNHPASDPITYIITSENGVKVFHTADSLPFEEMEQIAAKEKFDVVFCTVGIAPGTSPETGFEIARLTKPYVAVPYHANSVAYQKKFAEIVKKELPRTTCLIPELNKIYQVSKKS
jgi:L-ascorbate metabolism protein UlaG (beta-lactamase superfamily)